MRSNQHSPLWPYLLVLTGLFVLSVAVPRGWQDPKRPEAKKRVAPPPVVRWSAAEAPSAPVRPAATPLAENLDPLVEKVAAKIAGLRHFLQSRAAAKENEGQVDHVVEANRSSQTRAPATGQPTLAVPPPEEETELETAYWPVPHSLIAQLQRVSESPAALAWAAQTEELCLSLCRTPPGEVGQAEEYLRQLESLIGRADSILPQLSNPQLAADLRRARYSLQRRLLIWNVALTAAPRKEIFANIAGVETRRRDLKDAIADVEGLLAPMPYSRGWRDYLRLDDVVELAEDGRTMSRDESARIARVTLSRIAAADTTADQREVLTDSAVVGLATQLRLWAADPVDTADVLAAIERYEADRLGSDGREIVWAGEQLRWSADERDRELARHIDNHYRNANIRVVLSADLLNRLAPQPTAVADNVDDTVLGNPVIGSSITSTQLRVRLIPDPRRVHLWIEAAGDVDSSTRAYSGPATFRNEGAATYVARKAVVLDRRGLGIAHTLSEADSDAWLTGVSTDYDGFPLLGRLARNYAVSQHDALRPEARQEVVAKVATKAGHQLNSEVDRRLAQAEAKVRREWLDPLQKMGLELKPITMETVPERATMRLRLAGGHQPGGHTARPQAPSDSLASVQLHESALNNFMEELQLAGRSFVLPDLYKHLAQRTSRPLAMPDDLPDDVSIRFAEKDPIRVRCRDGAVELTLAIDELRQGPRMWHDFLISTNYAPEVDGRHARLERDGAIKLGGDTYRGQTEVVLRGIFSKILSRERSLELMPQFLVDHPRLADLSVTQCIVEDGWVALALGPDRTARNGNPLRQPATAAAGADLPR